jgi:hypothetical protein
MFRFHEPVVAFLQMVCVPLLLARGLRLQEGWASRWYTGTMICGLLIIVGHGLQIPQPVTFGIINLLTLGLYVRAKNTTQVRSQLATEERVSVTLLIAVLAIPAASAVLRTVHDPVVDWDAFAIWFAKARALDAWVPVHEMPHRNYPELGPVLWMSAFKWMGPAQESIGRAIFPILYFVWAASLMDVFGRPYSLSAAFAILLSAVLVLDVQAVTSGYQDAFVLVGAGFAASKLVRLLIASPREASSLLQHFNETAQRKELLRIGFLTGVIGLIKQEGTVCSMLLTGSFLLVLLLSTRPSAWTKLVRALRPFFYTWLPTVAVWPAILVLHQVDVRAIQGDGFTVSSILNAFQQVDRWPLISPYVTTYLESRLSLTIVCGAGSVASFIVAPSSRRPIVFLWTVFALHFAFVILVFFSTQADLSWHLETAFQRLVQQAGFALVLLVFVTLTSLLRDWVADVRMLAALWRVRFETTNEHASEQIAGGQR